MNSYKDRYRYSQELKHEPRRPGQRKKRKHHVSRHRKEAYSDHLAPSGTDDDVETLEIPTIEHIRLSGTTRRKLLERRISLLQERDKHTNVESRFSDRELQAVNVYHPTSSHSSHHTRTIHSVIPENEVAEESEYGANMNDVQTVRKAARNHRTSVLKKAERLLHERKRQDLGSSSEADTEDSPRIPPQPQQQRLARPSTYVARRSRSRSPSSEREYVNVPEVVDPDDDNSDLPLIDFEIEGSLRNYSSMNRNELHSNENRLHSNEGSLRKYSSNRRLDIRRNDDRMFSSESRSRPYLKSSAQVRVFVTKDM